MIELYNCQKDYIRAFRDAIRKRVMLYVKAYKTLKK